MSVVLVLRALGLGDLLTAVPALRALRAARTEDRLVLAAPDWLRPIVELADVADELHPTPGLHELRWPRPRPDLAVNLHGRGPDSIADLAATGPRGMITFAHPSFPRFPGPEWPADIHETQRWCLLLESAGIPADPSALTLPLPAETAIDDGRVLVHPGGSSAARRWPAQRFAAVAGHLARLGYRVVVTGDAAERRLALEVAHLAGIDEHAVLAGKLPLRRLACLVAGAALVISGDTGVGHLASAFGTPSVLVFGPNPPHWWGPPPRPEHRVLWAGHIGDPHAGSPDPGLLRISADEVLRAAERQLSETAGRRCVT